MQLGRARWYIDADTLGVAAILVRARPDITFPRDTGERHIPRWRLPPCAITSTDIPDVEWILKVTAAGLAIITRDRAMLSRRREVAAIIEASAQMFTIAPATNLSSWQQLQIVARHWDEMESIRDREAGPFVYLLSRTTLTRADLEP
jgi:hypothetical protein